MGEALGVATVSGGDELRSGCERERVEEGERSRESERGPEGLRGALSQLQAVGGK